MGVRRDAYASSAGSAEFYYRCLYKCQPIRLEGLALRVKPGRKAAGAIDPVHQFAGEKRILAGGEGSFPDTNAVQEAGYRLVNLAVDQGIPGPGPVRGREDMDCLRPTAAQDGA